AASDPPPQLLIDALTEIGDWYQTTTRTSQALHYYEQAAAVHSSNPGRVAANPLEAPRIVFYRPPLLATRRLGTMDGQYRVRRAVFEFRVLADGSLEDIAVVESDMSEGQLAQTRRALARAIYSPRFEDGKAVASEGVRFTAEWAEAHLPEAEAEDATAQTADRN
ncbi:MAG TPA: hypothetical protein VLA56_18570, partial [Pseudomonadales bacterium]|nr:hypothetical protein [Pseudomonadales bacterium]